MPKGAKEQGTAILAVTEGITLHAGLVDLPGSSVTRIGPVVVLALALEATEEILAGAALVTLPVEYRPAIDLPCGMFVGVVSRIANVKANGAVTMELAVTGPPKNIYVNAAYRAAAISP